MSPARIGFDKVGSSEEKPPEEIKGSGLVGGDKELEIDLDGEPRSLLDSLNAWQEKVVVGELLGFLGFLAL